MPVNVTVTEVLAAIKAGDSTQETAAVTRLLAVATELVNKHCPGAPQAIQDQCAILFVGYVYDAPASSPYRSDFSTAWRNSGAANLCLPWRIHSAKSVKDATTAAVASGSTTNPVIDLTLVGDMLTVSYANGTMAELTLPAGMGGSGIDQTARDSAAMALAAAAANTATLAGLPSPLPAPSGGGGPVLFSKKSGGIYQATTSEGEVSTLRVSGLTPASMVKVTLTADIIAEGESRGEATVRWAAMDPSNSSADVLKLESRFEGLTQSTRAVRTAVGIVMPDVTGDIVLRLSAIRNAGTTSWRMQNWLLVAEVYP